MVRGVTRTLDGPDLILQEDVMSKTRTVYAEATTRDGRKLRVNVGKANVQPDGTLAVTLLALPMDGKLQISKSEK